jgi:predicted alpha/beta superfamily hydrolase
MRAGNQIGGFMRQSNLSTRALAFISLLTACFTLAVLAIPVNAQQIESRELQSTALDELRPLLISAPSSWDGTSHALPVLYVLDAEEHMPFAAVLANSHSTYDFAGQDPYPDMLVVGIPNTDRYRDMSTTPGEDTPNGGAGAFLGFMAELKAFIGVEYNVSGYSVMFSHSASGEFAVFAMSERPDLFDAYILAEPAIRARDYELADRLASVVETGVLDDTRIYLSLAGEIQDFRVGAAKLTAVLEARDEEGRHTTQEFDGETHYTLPVFTFIYGLRHAYADAVAPDPIVGAGLAAVLTHRVDYCEQIGCDPLLPRAQAERVARFQAGRGDHEAARDAWQYYMDNYPGMAAPYFGLGDAYEALGEFEQAARYLGALTQYDPRLIPRVEALQARAAAME